MSPSGNYVVAMWTNGLGTRLYTRSLSYVRTLFSDYAHSDFAFDADGNEVMVYDATSGNQVDELSCPNPPNGSPLASARLFDGQKRSCWGTATRRTGRRSLPGRFSAGTGLRPISAASPRANIPAGSWSPPTPTHRTPSIPWRG